MANTVSDVMTRNPATVEADSPVSEAARLMKTNDAGAIIVLDNGRVSGIITDRDVAIRVIAEGKDGTTPVREACSAGDMTVVGPDTSVNQAVQLMRTNAIRRLPVVENDRPVGILSIGDLAMEQDEQSALADISAAPGDQ